MSKSVDPDLGLHCLQMSKKWDSRLIWVKDPIRTEHTVPHRNQLEVCLLLLHPQFDTDMLQTLSISLFLLMLHIKLAQDCETCLRDIECVLKNDKKLIMGDGR